jgi:hypothetical protein
MSQQCSGRLRVSIPYWLGSKLRGCGPTTLLGTGLRTAMFQSPIGWGLSCESWTASKEVRSRTGYLAFQSPIGWGLSCETLMTKSLRCVPCEHCVSIPYWLGSKLRDGVEKVQLDICNCSVSIPYWLGSKLRGLAPEALVKEEAGLESFQSPIGWGLSCEATCERGFEISKISVAGVSIPYWLGSKLRE